MCRSLPQIVVASTETMASVGSISSGVGYFVPALLVGTVVDERFHGVAPSWRVSSVCFYEVRD